MAAPRLEWDLTPAEIEAMGSARVILDVASSVNHGVDQLTLDVAGTLVKGRSGRVGGNPPAGTDITAAVRSWISDGASGPLIVDVLGSNYSILTREFEGSRWNRPSPPRLFLVEPTEEVATEVAMRGFAGHYRTSDYTTSGNNPAWETIMTGAERNALATAHQIEFRVRLTECAPDARNN